MRPCTAEKVTDISGRGVGMDAVAAWAKSAGGSVEVASKPGEGTRVTLRLPANFLSAAQGFVH